MGVIFTAMLRYFSAFLERLKYFNLKTPKLKKFSTKELKEIVIDILNEQWIIFP